MSWLARPIFDGLNDKKRDYAASHDHILFVEEPAQKEIRRFILGIGSLWEQKQLEDISLSMQTISPDECRTIASEMTSFYDRKSQSSTEARVESVTDFFSPDTIHPTEAGYDMWGK